MARPLGSASSGAEPFETDRPPEADPVERARALAWRSLNRRDRTVDEVGGMLLGKRVEPAVADQVVTELIELGYLDDARYAERFAEDRRRLDGWGSERIARRLRELGVDREAVEAAVAAQDPEEEMAAALELLRRRCPAPPATRLERDRALGMLMRRGYAPELALDALRRHAGAASEPDPWD
jgi:regulatory protein